MLMAASGGERASLAEKLGAPRCSHSTLSLALRQEEAQKCFCPLLIEISCNTSRLTWMERCSWPRRVCLLRPKPQISPLQQGSPQPVG